MITSRYGPSVYGSPLVYGATPATGLLLWSVLVDWDNDGVFTGENEAIRMVGFESFRGRRKMVKKAGFEVISPGRFSITLKNQDGRYDEFNSSSDLYPYVKSGVDIRIEITDQATSVMYPVITGIIEEIVPDYYKNDRIVKVYCIDTSSYLNKNSARVPVSTSVAPETLIGSILDYMSWPSRWGRNLDVTTDVMPYAWSRSSVTALTDLQSLADGYLGYFFSDNTGKARFIGRTSNSSSVVDFTQDQILKDIGNNSLYDNYRNVVRVKVHPRVSATSGPVYQLLGNKPFIEDAQSEEIWGEYSYSGIKCPATSLVTPVATTDYTFNTASDGSGVDKTAQVSVVFTNYGDSCKFFITNLSGFDVYCTKLQVRGVALYEQAVSDITYPTDVSTVTNQRELILDSVFLQDIDKARDIASGFGLFISTRNPTPTIKVESRPSIQFLPDLFDIVTATIDEISLLGNSFRVSGIEHRTLNDTCQSVLTTFYLEPYMSGSVFWTWPVTDFGVDTIFGW